MRIASFADDPGTTMERLDKKRTDLADRLQAIEAARVDDDNAAAGATERTTRIVAGAGDQ